ncbi:hypothetical protein HG537_0G03110 [Torulaspora globosa]|uniref:Tyr recombinase Flp-type domain-containing protein n=1 Tax=Torulaspora globosa TaxID=48254 RepID=A0A7H9HZQ7_9SACH|nr:hypothetical protein HG537_0G03110 [Torulaspora sp. CBS 2947]
MVMLLLKYTVAKSGNRKGRKCEIKRNTFDRYRRVVSKSVAIKSKDPKIIGFSYFIGRQPDLQDEINEYFEVVTFEITSAKKSSMKSVLERCDDIWGGLEAQKELSTVDEAFKKLLAGTKSLHDDILRPVIEVFQAHTRLATTRAEYPFMFLATIFNCCRQSDLAKADPSTFTLVNHEYLGPIVQCLVTETKTRVPRFIEFYPVAGAYDPIVALDLLLRSTESHLQQVSLQSKNINCFVTIWCKLMTSFWTRRALFRCSKSNMVTNLI